MDTTLFLAQFWGWLLVALSLVFVLRRKLLVEILRLAEDRYFTLFTGFISLLIGLATVIVHNVWTADWRVIVTIFGWLALLKGVVRIGFPEMLPKVVRPLKENTGLMQGVLVLTFLLGACLLYVAY